MGVGVVTDLSACQREMDPAMEDWQHRHSRSIHLQGRGSGPSVSNVSRPILGSRHGCLWIGLEAQVSDGALVVVGVSKVHVLVTSHGNITLHRTFHNVTPHSPRHSGV